MKKIIKHLVSDPFHHALLTQSIAAFYSTPGAVSSSKS